MNNICDAFSGLAPTSAHPGHSPAPQPPFYNIGHGGGDCHLRSSHCPQESVTTVLFSALFFQILVLTYYGKSRVLRLCSALVGTQLSCRPLLPLLGQEETAASAVHFPPCTHRLSRSTTLGLAYRHCLSLPFPQTPGKVRSSNSNTHWENFPLNSPYNLLPIFFFFFWSISTFPLIIFHV